MRNAIARLGLIVILAGAFPFPGSAQPKPFAIRSISFPLIGTSYLDDISGWTPIPTVIQQLKALGANDVKVTISAGAYDSPLDNLPDPAVSYNPSEDKILTFLKQLKAAGFGVTLQPFVNVIFDPSSNLLDTVHPQPRDFNAWISAHTAVMVHFAQMARSAGVDRFTVIGDEVQILTFDSAKAASWLSMIAQIRALYSGTILNEYGADGTVFAGGNTHIDLTPKSIHAAVDIIGIGWFPGSLTDTWDPTMCQLMAGWRRTTKGVDTLEFLTNVHNKYDKPVFIADAAFHSFGGDNISPNDIYDPKISLTASPSEQANEIDSYLTILSQLPSDWFLGISVDSWNRWPLDYNLTARFLNSPYGENVRGKLAETVLMQWFNGQRIGGPSLQCVNLTNGSAALTTTGNVAAAVRSGYASVDVNSGGSPPYGTAVFSLSQNNVVVSEAGIPASPPTKTARVFIDFRGGLNIDTGVALVNPGAAAAAVTFTLRGTDGKSLATGHAAFAAGAHIAKFIDQLRDIAADFALPSNFGTATQFGTLEITSDQVLSIVALRLVVNERGETILTSTPVADQSRPLNWVPVTFPQFADGGGYVTSIVLMNTSSLAESGKLSFADDSGKTDSDFSYNIPAGGAFILSTDGTAGTVRIGSVRLIPDNGTFTPAGSALIRFRQSGVLVTETGVPAAMPTTHARIFVDTTGGHDTGLAVAAVDNAGVTPWTLRHLQGHLDAPFVRFLTHGV